MLQYAKDVAILRRTVRPLEEILEEPKSETWSLKDGLEMTENKITYAAFHMIWSIL
jgi:hypothetical protein